MITLPNNVEVHFFAGAAAMSGTLGASAASTGVSGFDQRAITLTSNSHGIKASTDIFLDNVKAATTYLSNRMRRVIAVATNTMTLGLDRKEAFAAVTPAGTEAWCAGYVKELPYFFLGFKLHLSAADASGEAFQLATDAYAGAYWDELIFKKANMTGVTDIIYFPDVKIPMNAYDILKFSWTNTGTKTWGLELWTQGRV